MRRRLPPLNSLLAFDAAARHGSFTRAAKELGVAQPAVTRHISNLEDWIGAELFMRKGNSVELSKDGYVIADLTSPLLDRLELGLGQFSTTRENEVVIGASFGMVHMWLIPQITAMRKAAKGAVINFLTSENYADFESATVDLSIRFGRGSWPGKDARLIFGETLHVIASPDFLTANPGIDPNKLPQTLNPEWLLDHGDPYNYGWMTWQRWYDHHGVPAPSELKGQDIYNYPTLLDMVRCGEGVALGFMGLDDQMAAAGDIVRLGPALNRADYGYYLLSDPTRKRGPAELALAEYLAPEC